MPPALLSTVTTVASSTTRVLIAAGAVAIAFVSRVALRAVLGAASPFLLFTPAVAISARYGGVGSGVVATIASAFLGSHFFLGGSGEPRIEQWDRVALFVLIGALITALDAASRRSRVQIDESLRRERLARADAEAANRAKDRFLAMVSHELQTPMAVVLGWSQALRRRPMDPVVLERAVGAIERNATLQTRLVADLLDVSRAASGRLRIQSEPIEISHVLRVAIEEMERELERRGLQLVADIPDSGQPLVGDAVRLRQVFGNLITNAIKFTPAPGRIDVGLVAGRDEVTITVADSGAGIRPEFLPFVFDPFRQDRASAANQGLGLGLAITRACVEAHGGHIRAESDGLGKGARFIVQLPRGAAATPADRPRPGTDA